MVRKLGTAVLAMVLVSVASALGLATLILAGEALFGLILSASSGSPADQPAGEFVAWVFLLLYSCVVPYALLWLVGRRTALARSVAWIYLIVAAATALSVTLAAFGVVRPGGGLLFFGFDPGAHGIVVWSIWSLVQSALTLTVALYWLVRLNGQRGQGEGPEAADAHG